MILLYVNNNVLLKIHPDKWSFKVDTMYLASFSNLNEFDQQRSN